MSDMVTKRQRSENMRKIKSKNTQPELIVRKLMYSMGYRYRLYKKDLPGKPDLVLKKYKTALFINGCFWHQHKNCKRATQPKTNRHYWNEKLIRNQERDKENYRRLEEIGWKVVIIWECETKDSQKLKEIIKDRVKNG
jgi:DNA mismatch endonuclease, patch repair protein